MDIAKVQRLLKLLGQKIDVDGVDGPLTRKALDAAIASLGGQADLWAEIQYFTREEFRCKCGGKFCDGFPAEPREDLVRLAEAARVHFGRPGIVVSGLRCRDHNARCGGAENSQHMYGEACDLQIQGVSSQALLEFFLAQPQVRYAYRINETNVHFDVAKGVR